jgi:hypothetical protein
MIRRQTQYVCTIFNFQKKINQIIRLVKHLIGICYMLQKTIF